MTQLWINSPPFHGVIFRADGSLRHLEPRATVEEVLVDLKAVKYEGQEFIHNANGASAYPHKASDYAGIVPEQRKPKMKK